MILLLDGLRGQHPVLLIYIGVEQSHRQTIVDDGLHFLLLATGFLSDVEQCVLVPKDIIAFFFVDKTKQGSERGNSCRVMAAGDAAHFPVLQEIDI